MKKLFCLFICTLTSINIIAQDTMEQDKDESCLFYIARSRDIDRVVYSLNTNANGVIDSISPITIYWDKKTQNGKKEPLTEIQNKYGYGIKYLENTLNNNNCLCLFKFVSFEDMVFTLIKQSNTYKVIAFYNNKSIILNDLFIKFKNNSFWFPSISRVDINGQNLKTKKYITESYFP